MKPAKPNRIQQERTERSHGDGAHTAATSDISCVTRSVTYHVKHPPPRSRQQHSIPGQNPVSSLRLLHDIFIRTISPRHVPASKILASSLLLSIAPRQIPSAWRREDYASEADYIDSQQPLLISPIQTITPTNEQGNTTAGGPNLSARQLS